MDATSWAGLSLILILWSSWTAVANNNVSRLRRLERKVDLILNHLGLDPNPGINQRLLDLLKAGKKIQAIKEYRVQTGVGLKDAKDYVESL